VRPTTGDIAASTLEVLMDHAGENSVLLFEMLSTIIVGAIATHAQEGKQEAVAQMLHELTLEYLRQFNKYHAECEAERRRYAAHPHKP
jgi:hypothetical protein